MVTSLERHITYICPLCGMVTTRQFSPFAFSGRSRLDIVCPNPLCGTPCLSITDKKSCYSVTSECPVCGDIHSAEFRRRELWQEPIVSVNCRETGIGICFIGKKAELRRALQKAQADFAALDSAQADFYEDYVPENGDKSLGERISLASDILHTMAEDNALSCRCGNRSISITLIDGSLRLRCKRCGSMRAIEPSNEFLRSIASLDSYIFNK